MSDITGPPPPKPLQPVSHGTDRAGAVPRDKQQTTSQDPNEKNDSKSKSENRDSLNHVRDPAVSISASAAHLYIGEELKQKVSAIDIEGRPIIVTETATFALRPDAGLKPGDDISLQVKEAGKQVSADLLALNGKPIDPPLRLTLVVIAIHTPEQPSSSADTLSSRQLGDGSTSYKPGITSIVAQLSETDMLAQLLARNYTPTDNPGSFKADTQNTDPTVRASSADLATLISAQQALYPANNTVSAPVDVPLENILKSDTPQGLGPVLHASTPEGAVRQIQHIDPSVSRVPPAEVAEVITIRPLQAHDARTLGVNPAQIDSSGELARLETTKGDFILGKQLAEALNGELIRVTTLSATAKNAVPAGAEQQPSFKARLYNETTGNVRTVMVQFPETPVTANVNARMTEVAAVHVLRGFLTAEGPKNDLKLDTALGNLNLTLANNLRPRVGDTVMILPQDATASHTPLPQAMPVPMEAVSATALQAGASAWPALDQAYSLVATTDPAMAGTIAARTADGGGKLLNSMMFLFAALGGKTPTPWLGQKAESLLAEKNNSLLDILKNDIGRLFTAADSTKEWRGLSLPFDMRNGETTMLHMLFGPDPRIDPDKQNKHQENEDLTNEKAQHFVVEVEFSIIGPIQLNGLIAGKKFDLAVHSHQGFSSSLQQDCRVIFTQALDINGFSGGLSFKNTDHFPIDMKTALQQAAS